MPVEALKAFKDEIVQRDMRIAIQHDFWFGHSAAAPVANVSKTWSVGVTSEQTVSRLFAKFRREVELSIAPQTISRPLETMIMVKKLETWVQHALMEEQLLRFRRPVNQYRGEVKEPFLYHILTVDEK
ncbi:hypothetical protein TNCV_431941 [Trichonephila clavipes]|nr:hypothetical protein TNCV_431941 [Trichonephila clavipes]